MTIFLTKKRTKKIGKTKKRSHVHKGYTSTYDVDILNFFNLELQFKDTETVIKNKLTDLLPESTWFKFVTAMFIDFKKNRKWWCYKI